MASTCTLNWLCWNFLIDKDQEVLIPLGYIFFVSNSVCCGVVFFFFCVGFFWGFFGGGGEVRPLCDENYFSRSINLSLVWKFYLLPIKLQHSLINICSIAPLFPNFCILNKTACNKRTFGGTYFVSFYIYLSLLQWNFVFNLSHYVKLLFGHWGLN